MSVLKQQSKTRNVWEWFQGEVVVSDNEEFGSLIMEIFKILTKRIIQTI